MTALSSFDALVERSAFASDLATYLADQRRMPQGFYQANLAAGGIEAAEAALRTDVELARREFFTSCVEPIAQGALALATAVPSLLHDLSQAPVSYYRRISVEFGPVQRYAILLSHESGGSLYELQRGELFAPAGNIPLIGIVFETGNDWRRMPLSTMELVFPVWGSSRHGETRGSVTVAQIETYAGSLTFRAMSPNPGTDCLSFFRHLFHIPPRVDGIGRGGSVTNCYALGFPGSWEYLQTISPTSVSTSRRLLDT